MTTTTQSSLAKLLSFLDSLEHGKIHYRLAHVRDSLMVEIDVPGEKWEVEFFDDGEIEIERFVSTFVHAITEDELAQLVAEYSD